MKINKNKILCFIGVVSICGTISLEASARSPINVALRYCYTSEDAGAVILSGEKEYQYIHTNILDRNYRRVKNIDSGGLWTKDNWAYSGDPDMRFGRHQVNGRMIGTFFVMYANGDTPKNRIIQNECNLETWRYNLGSFEPKKMLDKLHLKSYNYDFAIPPEPNKKRN